MKFAFGITDWQARAPGLSETEQWHEWPRLSHATDPTAPLTKLNESPITIARHLSSGGELVVDCGLVMLCRHDINIILYTSRRGELERNYRILHALAARQALLPADFALSVHNPTVDNLTIAMRKPIAPFSLSVGGNTFRQELREVIGLLQTRYQRILMADFDSFLPEFYHPQLPPDMLAWSFVVALIIEPDGSWQRETRPHNTQSETTLPQGLLFLQHYLQDARTFALLGERVQWR